MRRSFAQKALDAATFPLRAFWLFHEDKCGLSSLASERFDYVAAEVSGYCLDIGCGRHNRFIRDYVQGCGRGVDLFHYEGLGQENLVEDLSHLPFDDGAFESVTFIANLNHCPRPKRDQELREAFRVLTPGGRIVVTMGNPLAEILVHQVVWLYDKLLKTHLDVDGQRGMNEEEDYYLTDAEIRQRLLGAGFVGIRKKYFLTQWGLNHLFAARKPSPGLA